MCIISHPQGLLLCMHLIGWQPSIRVHAVAPTHLHRCTSQAEPARESLPYRLQELETPALAAPTR